MNRHYDVIYKYKLSIDASMKPQIIEMPGYTEILTVIEQDKQIVLYAKHSILEDGTEYDWKKHKQPFKFLVLGTGWEYDLPVGRSSLSGKYVGTVMIDGYVWHVYHLWN